MTDYVEIHDRKVNGPAPDEPERYRIGGERELAWAIRKIGRARELAARADQHRKDAVEWAKGQKRPLERDESFFEGLAVGYVRGLVEAQFPEGVDPAADADRWGSKSIVKRWSTPWGYVQARRTEAKIVVDDPEAWVGWQTDTAEARLTPAKDEDLLAALSYLRDAGWTLTYGRTSAPSIDEAWYRLDGLGNICAVDPDGEMEIIPGLRWHPAEITYSVTVTSKAEFPAYDPAPIGSELPESAPYTEADI